jgi:hypothetical protein
VTDSADRASPPRTPAALDELGLDVLPEAAEVSLMLTGTDRRTTGTTGARSEIRWPQGGSAPAAADASSVLTVPVPVPHLTAGPTVSACSAHVFTDDDRFALTEFAAHAATVLLTTDALQGARELAANLQEAMESRAVIEQAKGILIERYRVTSDQAFRLLADASMRANRTLRELAGRLVLTGELSGAPPARRSPPPGG